MKRFNLLYNDHLHFLKNIKKVRANQRILESNDQPVMRNTELDVYNDMLCFM